MQSYLPLLLLPLLLNASATWSVHLFTHTPHHQAASCHVLSAVNPNYGSTRRPPPPQQRWGSAHMELSIDLYTLSVSIWSIHIRGRGKLLVLSL